ncbi:hypothetical protein AMAG_12710 [Allomyces macrogynus ATCC 38327]|uniref:Uncharacterized protein n=1 Tax=Allomyces macrogynus (strain ATCC 38327) TaxID=578462 RepID=A0A0L0T1E0_ALLM3|nr:hypothetical protein AMAG_12710 [Allomyces macrogynus ATCC 38327]|eukprot:KNE68542.1 hypothetical protein AMAG_12710 [Allomyces macrogynus ATCC 38327]
MSGAQAWLAAASVVLFFLTLVTGGGTIFFTNVGDKLPNPVLGEYHWWGFLVSMLFAYVAFIAASVSDPGFITRVNHESAIQQFPLFLLLLVSVLWLSAYGAFVALGTVVGTMVHYGWASWDTALRFYSGQYIGPRIVRYEAPWQDGLARSRSIREPSAAITAFTLVVVHDQLFEQVCDHIYLVPRHRLAENSQERARVVHGLFG